MKTGERYPMCADQAAQIDCRNTFCKFHINGSCVNVSPAITLSIDPALMSMVAKCWSFKNKGEDKEVKPEDLFTYIQLKEWAEENGFSCDCP